jgi:2-dehydro-3-deoxyphosphooctonate aldolase (KDO 8-P synthase)
MIIKEREFFKTKIGGTQPFFLIAGPCVIESRDMLKRICETMQNVTSELGIQYIFKASFDKANRSSASSKRGPGIEEGLRDLEAIKNEFHVPILTDIHDLSQVKPAAEVVDILQIPAFLSRQTDLIYAAADTGRWVNIKKGQFMAPGDADKIADKMKSRGNEKYLVTERGVSFGYNNLVFDPRSIEIMHRLDIPVVFDGTHSTQMPGGGEQSGGDRTMAPVLMKAAVAVGIEGLFMEVHPNPPEAWSDSSNQYYLDQAPDLLRLLYRMDRLTKTGG